MKRLAAHGLTVGLAAAFAAYVLFPLGMMMAASLRSGGEFSFAHYRFLFDTGNAGNLEAVVNSVVVSLWSVVLSGLLGLLLAFVFTQFDFPWKSPLSRLAVLPVALPPLVGVIAFLFVFGETGIIPRGLQMILGTSGAPLSVNGISGVVLVHVYSFHVYSFLFCSAALRNIDSAQLEAAAGLGSGPWRTFGRIVLPELRPALIGASALTFMASMASFTAPLLFAGDKRFITLQIYQTKLNGDLDLAAAQSILLTLVSVFFYGLLTSAFPSGAARAGRKGTARPGLLRVSGGTRRILLAIAIFVLSLEILPVAVILLLSFAREGSWTTQLVPSAYVADNYIALLRDPKMFEPVMNSLLLAGLTLAAALAFGIPAAFFATKGRRGKGRRVIQMVLTLPYAVPGTAIAVALILAFNSPLWTTGGSVLVGTFWILPLAYVVREYPLVLRSTAASLELLDDSLLEAADGLGASAWRKFRTVTFPAVLPGVVAGGVLVVIAALGEFVSSVLLYTYASRPVSVEILAQLRLFNIGAAAAYAVLLMVIILALLRVAERISSPLASDRGFSYLS